MIKVRPIDLETWCVGDVVKHAGREYRVANVSWFGVDLEPHASATADDAGADSEGGDDASGEDGPGA
jgi:hypothetical protein